MNAMWMLDQFRGAADRLRPVSLVSISLVLASSGCVQTPPARRVVTEPAPPLMQGGVESSERPGAADWRDPRDDSNPRQTVGAQGAAAAAREAAAAAGSATRPQSHMQLVREVGHTMDDWHQAASVGDRDRYIDHFAPDAVFLGTDATERWDMASFTAYVDEHFKPGSGWTYKPFNRQVTLGANSQVAWIDEELDSDGYGALRGTGVLRRDESAWKIVHYSMVFTVPNNVAREVVDVVRSALPAAGR